MMCNPCSVLALAVLLRHTPSVVFFCNKLPPLHDKTCVTTAAMPLAVSCFALFSAFCPTLQQKPPDSDTFLVVDYIRMKFRAFDWKPSFYPHHPVTSQRLPCTRPSLADWQLQQVGVLGLLYPFIPIVRLSSNQYFLFALAEIQLNPCAFPPETLRESSGGGWEGYQDQSYKRVCTTVFRQTLLRDGGSKRCSTCRHIRPASIQSEGGIRYQAQQVESSVSRLCKDWKVQRKIPRFLVQYLEMPKNSHGAENLIRKYQREINKKASGKAILCYQGYSAGN